MEFKDNLKEKFEKTMREIKKAVFVGIKRKLNFDYLAPRMGTLTKSVNTFIDFDKKIIYISVDQDYGKAYETGKWGDVKPHRLGDKYYNIYKRAIRHANPIWKGQKKRPFMRDSIKEADINSIIIKNMGTK